jgi:hypothetical protein
MVHSRVEQSTAVVGRDDRSGTAELRQGARDARRSSFHRPSRELTTFPESAVTVVITRCDSLVVLATNLLRLLRAAPPPPRHERRVLCESLTASASSTSTFDDALDAATTFDGVRPRTTARFVWMWVRRRLVFREGPYGPEQPPARSWRLS